MSSEEGVFGVIGWQSVIQERDSAAPTPEDTGTAAPGEMARPVKCPAGRRSNPRLPRSPVSAGTAEAQRGGKCDGANGDRPISDRQHVRAPAVGVAAGGRCIKLQPLSAQGGGLAPRSDSSPTRWPEKFVGTCSFGAAVGLIPDPVAGEACRGALVCSA